MKSKYEEILKEYLQSGLTLKEYCKLNNLNLHNTETGIYHYKKSLKKKENEIKVIKVVDEVKKDNKLYLKINDIDCSLYSNDNDAFNKSKHFGETIEMDSTA